MSADRPQAIHRRRNMRHNQATRLAQDAALGLGALAIGIVLVTVPLRSIAKEGSLSQESPVPDKNTGGASTPQPKDKISPAARRAFAGNPVLEEYFKKFPGTSVDYVTCNTSSVEFNGQVFVGFAAIGDSRRGQDLHSEPGESDKTIRAGINASEARAARELLIEDLWGSKIVHGVFGDYQEPLFTIVRSKSGTVITDQIAQRGLDQCLGEAGRSDLVLGSQQTK